MDPETTTEQTPNEPGSKVDQGQGEGGEKKAEEVKVDYKAEFDKLNTKNSELEGLVKNSLKRANDAEAFTSTLTSKLEEIANRRSDPSQNLDPSEAQERLRERMNNDPVGLLDEHYQTRTAPLVQRFMEQAGNQNRQMFITKMNMTETGKEVLKDYLADVDDFLKDFGPEHRASPDAYDAALRWVRSKDENFEKEVERRVRREREKEKTHFVEGSTAGGAAAKEVKRELSSIEKEVAKGLGISDDEYLKYKEG